MASERLEQFWKERERLNDIVMAYAGRDLKRLYHIDDAVYKDGALPAKTKELLGYVASLVLRCDDCITYHLAQLHDLGVTSEEFEEATVIGYVVGGSITVPHLRHAFDRWDELQNS
ncbi:MAG: carboxymuconolactone decarboxylase family protein [bacterium]